MCRRRQAHLNPIFGVKEKKFLIGCTRGNEALEHCRSLQACIPITLNAIAFRLKKNERIPLAAGRYRSRTSGTSDVGRRASQVITVRSYLSSWCAAEDRAAGLCGRGRRRGRPPRKSWRDDVEESGRAGRCHRCSALRRTGVVGWPSQRRYLSGRYPNEAWASRVLID